MPDSPRPFEQPGPGVQGPPPGSYQSVLPTSSGYQYGGHQHGGTDGARPPAGRGLAVAALVIGAVSVVFAVIPVLSYLALVNSVIGIVLAIVALTRGARGLGVAGLVTSAVALLLAVVLSVTYTAFLIRQFDALSAPVMSSTPDDPIDGESDDAAGDPLTGPGSRDEPYAIGTTAVFDDFLGAPAWEITPGAPTLDADAIIAADDFNDPPAEGLRWAILPLTVTYVGDSSGLPWQVDAQFVASDGTTYDTDDAFVIVPDDLFDSNELYPGGTVTGNVAIPLPIEGSETGTWAISTWDAGPYFYAAQ